MLIEFSHQRQYIINFIISHTKIATSFFQKKKLVYNASLLMAPTFSRSLRNINRFNSNAAYITTKKYG